MTAGFILAPLWPLLGCLVLSEIDARVHGALLPWARECPIGGVSTCVLLWPLILALWLWKERSDV